MTLLQLTEATTSVIASASTEERPFILLFMISVIIALCGALYLLYRDGKKEREANNEARIYDSGNYGKINLALGTDIANPYFGIDQPLQIMFSDSGISSSDLTLRLIIFYMEV